MIPEKLYPGLRLRLFAFGSGVIRKIYTHPETRESVCEVKSDGGELMHLSMKYASRLANE
jgi:hypothetical protein